jgi:hypothetical protein
MAQALSFLLVSPLWQDLPTAQSLFLFMTPPLSLVVCPPFPTHPPPVDNTYYSPLRPGAGGVNYMFY